MSKPAPQRRADARRNHARILAVAEAEVAEHGAGASLEQIARVAGVGSATVRRHFPTRRALLESVARARIDALCARAAELERGEDARAALLEWLGDVVAYCASARGFAAAIAVDGAEPESVYENACSASLERAGAPLLRRAEAAGAVDGGVTMSELITLIVGIALATEHHAAPEAQAERLFQVAVAGLSPAG
ncbi:transcriptional regulator, TetR family [Streptomyces zhaozhouensis]|uniref:Transcriptional regulator, TetR family n=1 Tax=Streptomyces zhaozhouensis TaxID=1300267 RepID=A0A286DIB8_9ACTN|nr:TetR/AcrR family transcriptional regulator [Streptomyces zhaozhouensis]SOD58313.1 transcriptional regulator, TetR family [Streptomyces zhaozhouensis]